MFTSSAKHQNGGNLRPVLASEELRCLYKTLKSNPHSNKGCGLEFHIEKNHTNVCTKAKISG